MEIDKIDSVILSRLKRDARLSYRELGEAAKLSANAVAERIKRLTAEGVIRGFHADINPQALGNTLEVQIDVKLQPGTSAVAFERAIRSLPQIKSAMLLTGSFDYAVRVACADRDELVHVTETLRERAGVQETYSRVILRNVMMESL